jgi:uncharacterized protein (TIGR02271 family)
MERENREDRFAAIEDEYAGYIVYDMHYEKIGNVDDLFVDENDQPEYLGIKMGLLGLKSTLIPWEMVRVNAKRQLIEVSESKDRIKDAPTFSDDEEITPELEQRVYSHFGLQRGPAGKSAYRAYYRDTDSSSLPDTTGAIDEERRSEEPYGERRQDKAAGDIDPERGESHERPTFPEPSERVGAEARDARGSGVTGEDEMRVQRSEEELRAATREREAGNVNVRKRVKTERERLNVPKKREEVHVERVSMEDREASETQIRDGEIRVPVVEEEIVVQKRPVVKEELRIRKDVVEDEEIVEEDVRKEEVDIDDQTTRRDR